MPSTERILDDIEPSCILKSSVGTPVHIVGVSHTSPYYAEFAAQTVSKSRPSVLCLEVCEDRLREQALRGTLAVENRHSEIIRNAVRPFLENGVWAIAGSQQKAHHRLSNEGAAQLEGGFYGEEVTRSAIEATAAGADIVAADRSKSLSRRRFSACAQQKLSEHAETLKNDDISIVGQALCVAAENAATFVVECAAAFSMSNATHFGNSVHPIFHAAASPDAEAALAACGCDVVALRESLHHLMTEGAEPGAEISQKHMHVVRGCIRKVEQMRHLQHRTSIQNITTCSSTAAATSGLHDLTLPALDTSATLHCSNASAPGIKSTSWNWIPAMNELEASANSGKVPSEEDSFSVVSSNTSFGQVVSGVLTNCARATSLPEWRAWARKRAQVLEEAYMQTTVHERDCILAHRIRDVAEAAEPGKPVVAVVGANHVAGIVAAWERAQSPEFEQQCADYLTVPEVSSHPPQHAWKVDVIDSLAWAFEGTAVVAGTAVLTTAARRYVPRSVGVACTALAAGSLAVGVSSWWGNYKRPAQLVENLARFNDSAQSA